MSSQQAVGATQRYQTALGVFSAYILLQFVYGISRRRVALLFGRRAAPPITGTVALLATLSVWMAWRAPRVQKALPRLDAVSSAVAAHASAALSAGRDSVIHGVESAREYLDSRKAALDETLQAALEKRVAHIVDIVALRVQGAIVDADMPEFVQSLLRDSVRRVMPDVKQHMFKTTNKMLITPVKRLRIGPLFPPHANKESSHSRELEDDLIPPFKPCIPWPQLRAAVLYLMWPADRSVWRSARSKRWWAAQCLGIVPVLGQLWWLLLFFAKDKTDEHQLADFIVGFESSKFIATGVWSVVYGATRQHLCLHVIPPGATVTQWLRHTFQTVHWAAGGMAALVFSVLAALPTITVAALTNPFDWSPSTLSQTLLQLHFHDKRWQSAPASHILPPGVVPIAQSLPAYRSDLSPVHSCMTWGPTLSWLDAVFFLLQLVLVALAFGMLPWSRRRYVHSERARASSTGTADETNKEKSARPAVASGLGFTASAPYRPSRGTPAANHGGHHRKPDSPATPARSVRFIIPSVPTTPVSSSGRGEVEPSVVDSAFGGRTQHAAGASEGSDTDELAHQQGRDSCCQRTVRPCALAGCACSYTFMSQTAARSCRRCHARCVRRVSTWGLPRDSLELHGGALRPGSRTVSLRDRGGYLAATNVYFLWTSGITLLLGAAALVQYWASTAPPLEATWRLQSSLYWIRALFGVSAMPYMLFRVPLLMQLLVCAQRTAYDQQGNTVLAGGRSEFLPSRDAPSAKATAQSHSGRTHAATPAASTNVNKPSSTRAQPPSADRSGVQDGAETPNDLLDVIRRHTPPLSSSAPAPGGTHHLPPLHLPPAADQGQQASSPLAATPLQHGLAHVQRQMHSASRWLTGQRSSRQQRWRPSSHQGHAR